MQSHRPIDSLQSEAKAPEDNNASNPNADAEFVGWQKSRNGEIYALYDVTAEQHPLYRSTVSEKTLRKHNLAIPPTPQLGKPVKEIDDEE